MKRTEYILAFLAIIGIVSKIYGLPGTSILLIVSLSAFSIFSVVHSIIIARKDTTKSKAFIVLLGLGLAGCLIGITFIFMSWARAEMMLVFSGGLTLAIAIILASKGKIKNNFLIVKGFIIGGFALILFILPEHTIFKLKHSDDPILIELYIDMKESKSDSSKQKFSDYLIEKRKQLNEN